VAILKPISLPDVKLTRDLDAIDPFDGRYYEPEVAKYLSERSRISYQAYVEAALAQTLADFRICSRAVANNIESAARKVTAESVYEEEKTTRHDIKALVNCIKSYCNDSAKPYVHFGATSYDIIASANALQMRDVVNGLVIPRLRLLNQTLIELCERYAKTPQIGRTHGQHALPITFGFAMAEYVSRLGDSTLAIKDLTKQLPGKFSGAVGAYNALSLFTENPLKFEKKVLAYVGLKPAIYSTQITPPEYMIRLLDEMTIAAGVMANLAHDMRHLQRSEIAEVREAFAAGQTGSSTMAHKRNPWNFENIISLHKQMLAQMVNANLNISSEHQRDLTDSAASRFYGLVPAGLVSMATRLNKVMKVLEVDAETMARNLTQSGGAVAAEPLYLLLEKFGHIQAHEKSKILAHKALDEGLPLIRVIEADKEAFAYWNKFTVAQKQIVTNPEKYYTGLAAQRALQITKLYKSASK